MRLRGPRCCGPRIGEGDRASPRTRAAFRASSPSRRHQSDAGQSVGQSSSYRPERLTTRCWRDSQTGKATVLQARGRPGQRHREFCQSTPRVDRRAVLISLMLPRRRSDAVLWSRSGKATVLQDAGGAGRQPAPSGLNACRIGAVGQSYPVRRPDAQRRGARGRRPAGRRRFRTRAARATALAGRHQRPRVERRLLQHRNRIRRRAVVAVGEGHGPQRSAGAGLERYECLRAQ